MSAVSPFPKDLNAAVRISDTDSVKRSIVPARRQSTTLLLRLALFNLLAFGMVGAAWWEGYVATIVEADQTHLSVLICVVFVLGLLISGWRATQINREIDELNAFFHNSTNPGAGANDGLLNRLQAELSQGSKGALRLRLTHRIASVRHIANVLVLLGLIGTVLGFIIALSGVNPDSAGDIEGIAPMVSTLIQGMSTALYTTLIGSILNVWLSANHQMLASGTIELMSLWMEAEEKVKTTESSLSDA